jgi:hypothetical protein
VCEFATPSDAIDCRDRIVRSPLSPICLELLSPKASGTNAWTIAVRAGGSDRVLARYATEMGSLVTRVIDGVEEQKLWNDIEGLGDHSPVAASLSAPPASALEVLQTIEQACAESGLGYTAWGRIGIGSLLLSFDSGMAESYVATIAAIRNAVPRDASVIVTRCPSALKSEINVWGTSPTDFESMKAVKHALNPKNTLNRGRFLL